MAEPIVFDVRHGLTTDVLEGLEEAQRVPLAVKHQRAAVLGRLLDRRRSQGCSDRHRPNSNPPRRQLARCDG